MAEQSLAYWLALVDRLVEERFSAALEEHGVTRLQWRVLGMLSSGPATRDELAGALADGDPDELDELVESGWVLAGDRLEITDRGSGAYGGLADVVEELRATLTAGISAEEQAATIAALERMAANLGYDPSAPAG